MRVRDVITDLFFGELSSMSIAEEPIESLSQENQQKLVRFINNTLSELHSRFVLRVNDLIISSFSWKSTYVLDPMFSWMSDSDSVKYILDTASHPFDGRIVKILSVTNEVGDPLPMNDAEQWASVFTPDYRTVQLTHPEDGQAFGVTYQEYHPLLTTDENWLEQEIEIPIVLYEPMRLGVAIKFYSGMSGQDSSNKTAELLGRYDSLIADVEFRNLLGMNEGSTNIKLLLRGFP